MDSRRVVCLPGCENRRDAFRVNRPVSAVCFLKSGALVRGLALNLSLGGVRFVGRPLKSGTVRLELNLDGIRLQLQAESVWSCGSDSSEVVGLRFSPGQETEKVLLRGWIQRLALAA